MNRFNSTAHFLLPLSENDLDELDQFLMSEATSDETMMLDVLDGYLTAIVIGPTTLSFNHWFSGIWGPEKEDMPKFATMAEAQRIIDLIVRHMNGIIAAFEDDPDEIEPLFSIWPYSEGESELYDGESWAYGFVQGLKLCRKDWQPLFDDPTGKEMFKPLYLMGEEDVTPEEMELSDSPEQRAALTEQIPASIAWIYRFWLPYRQAMVERMETTKHRTTVKTGRNDPCPCGSGQKFKKCCGAGTIH